MRFYHPAYHIYQTLSDLTEPARALAKAAAPLFNPPWSCIPDSLVSRMVGAACEVVALSGLTHARPSFGIDSVTINQRPVAVREDAVYRTPFCTLLRFVKDSATVQPRVLVVAPVSGHFATLLRGTVETLLCDHDVYITDWHNARDIPRADGSFNLDDFILHVIQFMEVLGPGTHIVSVCQPTVPTLAAVALMAEDDHPAQPPTMTLIAGPMDTRINPTEVNRLATSKPIEWFERNLISTVPLRFPGALRRVYPGFLQITAFMAMNPGRHLHSFIEMYANLVRNEVDKAAAVKIFYEEYFATMDMPAEFYLQTVQSVFQEQHLAKGTMKVRDRVVNPGAIKRTALFTVEGEKDDICAVGQTLAAQDMCTGLRPYKKKHHVQTGAGHYGVFNGRRWQNEIYPLLRDFVHQFER